MSTKAARGTKRTCQSSECGARFYDLNRDPISCPICGSVYELASAPAAVVASAVGEEKSSRRSKKQEFVPVVEDGVPVEVPVDDGEVALPEVEGEEAIAAESDETFLEEEEEDGGDVSNIIGGSVAEDEEEP
jgi:uncharacterized protein (TIGR02300 family)